VTYHARGTFEVTLTPQIPEESSDGQSAARLLIDKQFRGDLQATSKGQMLSVGTDVKGSAGYVAMEWIRGVLRGRSGRFALQHSGTMTRGAPELSITVVPDSGTGELVGISGRMTIDIVDGKHSYGFDYTFAQIDQTI
jgi:hypothetical protein